MSHSPGQSGNSNLADSRTDPAMKSLFQMSRTAGVGLGDYAAVNVLSVVALIVGVACFLLLIFGDSYIMLLLPAATLVIGMVAILQIRNSNGTQVGKGLAGIGIALALIFGGINLSRHVRVAIAEGRDRAQIQQVVDKLASSATTQSAVPQAYELFHKRFKEQVNPETFNRTVSYRTGLLAKSPIQGIKLGENVLFETNKDTQVTTATALIVLISRHIDEQGQPVTADFPALFRRDGPNAPWTIYAIPDWFGKDEKPQ